MRYTSSSAVGDKGKGNDIVKHTCCSAVDSGANAVQHQTALDVWWQFSDKAKGEAPISDFYLLDGGFFR